MNHTDPIILELLKSRGITGSDEIAEFLSEKPRKTYDPFLLLNMDAGVDLILSAIKYDKKICVYGDYDADGITAACLMTQVLSSLTDKLEYYVPNRFDEGYGLNKSAIESIKDGGADMIITVDCGSVSREEAAYAGKLGLEMVVTDHHNIDDVIADCLVINPKQPGCGYPFKQLAGVGVAFKLAQAIQKKTGLPKSVLTGVLDLVAIGTIGDIAPLLDENRTLVKYGMRELNKLKRKGMKALAEAVLQKNSVITPENAAYVIVPHLNSAGRMLTADTAVELLASNDETRVRESVAALVRSNIERKKAQEETYRRCVEIINGRLSDKKCLLIFSQEIHEGIAGIVAGKIKDEYNRPAIIVTPAGEGLCKGTGRSIENVSLYDLLSGFKDLFVRFGGHAAACGFLMKQGGLEKLEAGLEARMDEIYEADPRVFDESGDYDLELSAAEVTVGLVRMIECLAPFGNQNRRPVFLIRGAMTANPVAMGEGEKHVRFTADGTLQCVLFNKAEKYRGVIGADAAVSLLGTAEAQAWNGSVTVRFMVERIITEEFTDGKH